MLKKILKFLFDNKGTNSFGPGAPTKKEIRGVQCIR